MLSQVNIDRFLRSTFSHSFKLNAYERILLVILASYAGKKDNCFPSHQSLSLDCGMSTDSIGRYAKLLEEKKLITINRIAGNNNFYQLNIPVVTPVADSTYRSQQLPANSDYHPPHTATSPPADSDANNINNDIKECTSLVNLKMLPTKSTQKNLPQDFAINDSHRIKAANFGLDVNAELECFKNHHLSKENRFANWEMAFHSWLNNAAKFSRSKKSIPISTDVMAGACRE